MAQWEAFQADVLDTIRQYQGFFDFFEQVGSVSDSRPDLMARVTREGKKEIWIVDAKAKNELNNQDIARMDKYVSKIKSNPVDVGLDYSELSKHSFRKIFVGRGDNMVENAEWVKMTAFHQFLQEELLYTDTDRIVRDIAKMMKNRQLDQQQARMLHESVTPYREVLNSAMDMLESMENRYTGLELKTGTDSIENLDVPIDAVLKHENRDLVFLIDIPYSRKAINEIREKIDSLKEDLMSEQSDIFYAAVNHFESTDEPLIYAPDELESEIQREAGIIDAETVAEIFKPKIPVKKSFKPGKAFISAENNVDFDLEVRIVNDSKVTVEAFMPEKAANELKNRLINSRMELGEFKENRFKMQFEIESGLNLKDSDKSFDSLRESVKSAFQPSVNPVLARMYNTRA